MRQLSCVKVIMRQLSAAVLRQKACNARISLEQKVDGDIIMRQLSCVKVIMRQLTAPVLRQKACNARVSLEQKS